MYALAIKKMLKKIENVAANLNTYERENALMLIKHKLFKKTFC